MLNPISEITNSVLATARRNALIQEVEIRKRSLTVLCQTIARRGYVDHAAQADLRIELRMLEAAQEALDK
jgi:hypothetical protein